MAHQPPHTLIAAHIFPPSEELEGGEKVGIKVSTPGEAVGCVIVQLDDRMDRTELLTGDRFVDLT
jgi:hypothetical protein